MTEIDMTKLNERKQSAFVSEALNRASQPFANMTEEARNRLIADYKAAKEKTPAHIKVIQDRGVLGVLRGYTDDDLKRYIEAEEIAEREKTAPAEFASCVVESALQSDKAKRPRNRKKPDYVEIWEYVEPKLRRGLTKGTVISTAVKHFESRQFSERKIRRVIDEATMFPERYKT